MKLKQNNRKTNISMLENEIKNIKTIYKRNQNKNPKSKENGSNLKPKQNGK